MLNNNNRTCRLKLRRNVIMRRMRWPSMFTAAITAPTAGPRWTEVTTLNVERPASCESALRGLQHQLID